MVDFGFKINTDRQIDLDQNPRELMHFLNHAEPSFQLCIQCGTCSATCSAASFTDFNPRKVFMMVKRGMTKPIKGEVSKCMLCGKCILACPKGVNTRNIMLLLKDKL